MTIEDYVHRVGRTGRAGETGTAITFFTRSNGRLARELIQVLKESKQTVPEELYSFKQAPQGRGFQRYGGRNSGGYSGSSGDYGEQQRERSRSPRRFY